MVRRSHPFACPRLLLCVLIGVALLVQGGTPATARGLIRDAEIERTLARIARPLFNAAGISPGRIDVLVVDDPTLNAFVIDNHTIFLHSGLIRRLPDIPMLQAVMAHELAHITSGHTVRRALNRRSSNTVAGLGMLLAAAIAASGGGNAAAGVAIGTASAANRNFLAHTRAEEATADQIGAQYMVRAGIDPRAAIKVLDIFRDQAVLSAAQQDPYSRTHPLSRDRIRALKGAIAAYGGRHFTPPSPDMTYWFGRMRAKFRGFVGNPSATLRHLKRGDTSEATRMARAIALHRQGKLKEAIALMDTLLRARPKDPFYHELKGQILLEGRQPKRAVKSYRTAVSLAPRQALIRAGLGRALLSLRTKSGNRAALKVLKKARQMDPRDARMMRDLALAWAKNGNNGMASLVTAERYALLGLFKDAKTNATRAEGLLPRGSRGWLRAEDVLATSKVALK